MSTVPMPDLPLRSHFARSGRFCIPTRIRAPVALGIAQPLSLCIQQGVQSLRDRAAHDPVGMFPILGNSSEEIRRFRGRSTT
jgi:hypothetical protein